MFLTFTQTQVHFCYSKKKWQYTFDEIIELGLIRKKRNYFSINVLFVLVTVATYYCMLFSKIADMYYVIPALLSFTILIILRFHDTAEFNYYVLVRDCYQKEIIVKIKGKDKNYMSKQIKEYVNIQFERITKKTA
jgi:hypothetical protein